jgi:enoyl-CoA hydratase/carnithine racemase
MLMLGETFDASQAKSWGLVETVVAPGMLDQAVEQWVESLFKCAPRAVILQKQLIRSWEDLPLRAAIATSIDTFGSAYATTEPREAMRRFLEENARRKREVRDLSEREP